MTTKLQKTIVTIGLLMIGWFGFYSGCTQVIIEPDRFQVNTLLMTSGLETLYYDPNGIFEVGKYKGVPTDIHFKFNPLTRTYGLVIDSNSL